MPEILSVEKETQKDLPLRLYMLLFSLATIVYIIGLFVDIMDIDAAQYASIAREMVESHSYFIIKYRHLDYLDKPPLLFWMSALSFKILGYSNFGYKLPSFLFTLLGTYATYKLASSLYNISTGRIAALLLYTCEAYFLFNNDVRTDALLANFVIIATWQLYSYLQNNKWPHAFFGCTAIACAMLAKGPIGLMVPVLALSGHLIYKKKRIDIFRIEWLLGLCWIMLLLLPMLIGLYRQYGTGGIKFFFWTQSFGRITGESTWKNNAGYFFFTHTFLWSFLPWSLFAVLALFERGKQLFRKTAIPELISFSGFVLPFIALSFSHYKLPHYIYVVFPFAAVLTAAYIQNILVQRKTMRVLTIVQIIFCIVLWLLLILLITVSFPLSNFVVVVLLLCALMSMLYIFLRKKNSLTRLLFPSALTFISVAFVLNVHVYPTLLKYQSGRAIAQTVLGLKIPKEELYAGWRSNSLEFYYGSILRDVTPEQLSDSIRVKHEVWVIADEPFKSGMDNLKWEPAQTYTFDHFPVTRLKLKFFFPGKRKELLEKHYLLQYAYKSDQ